MMALVHDLAEAQVGDIAPNENFTKAEKHRLEEVCVSRSYPENGNGFDCEICAGGNGELCERNAAQQSRCSAYKIPLAGTHRDRTIPVALLT